MLRWKLLWNIFVDVRYNSFEELMQACARIYYEEKLKNAYIKGMDAPSRLIHICNKALIIFFYTPIFLIRHKHGHEECLFACLRLLFGRIQFGSSYQPCGKCKFLSFNFSISTWTWKIIYNADAGTCNS